MIARVTTRRGAGGVHRRVVEAMEGGGEAGEQSGGVQPRFLSSWRMTEFPSESRITDMRQTGEGIISALNFTPFALRRAISASRASTSRATLAPESALGLMSEVANRARHPPPGRSYSVHIPFGAWLPGGSPSV